MSTKDKLKDLENKQDKILEDRSNGSRKILTQEEVHTNPDLWIPINASNNLQKLLVEYVGKKHNPENGEVNINMIAETLATDFPEFAFAYAEENFLRGYQLGLEDGENMAEMKKMGARFDWEQQQNLAKQTT